MAIRPAGDYDVTYVHDMAIVRNRFHWALAVGFPVLLFALPAFFGGYFLGILNMIGITIIAVQGLSILTGYTGQISLGQAAFMMVGSYTSALLVTRAGIPFWFALPIAGLMAGLVGLLFGLPSLRIKGFYLAMATLAAQFIIPWFFRNVRKDLFGGAPGVVVPPPELGSLVFNTPGRMYFIIVVVVCITTLVAKNITRSRLGRAFIAIRDNDLAAEVMGINPFAYKLRAFFISALYAGLAGSLWAHYARAINPDQLSLTDSVWFLGMIIVGGMGSNLGPVLGATFIRLLREFVIVASPWIGKQIPSLEANILAALGPIIFATALILFLVFEPRGLAHRWELLKAAYRLRPFAH